MNNSLSSVTTNIINMCDEITTNIKQSLKTIEFLEVYQKTKGKNLDNFIESYSNKLNAESEWFLTWSDILLRNMYLKNGFNKIVRECTKINKTRAKAQAKAIKEQAKAQAKTVKPKTVKPTITNHEQIESINNSLMADWLNQARKYQTRLKTDTRAKAPEPINLIVDERISQPLIMGRQRNIKQLESYKIKATPENKIKIDNIVKL